MIQANRKTLIQWIVCQVFIFTMIRLISHYFDLHTIAQYDITLLALKMVLRSIFNLVWNYTVHKYKSLLERDTEL